MSIMSNVDQKKHVRFLSSGETLGFEAKLLLTDESKL